MADPIIMVVDDEAPHMKALCDTLRDHEFVTHGFTSGKEALAYSNSHRIDIVLSDLMMPEMDGIALLREILSADANIVGIIMTGAGTIATAVEAMKVGALDYVLKPFKLRDLLPVLSRAMTVRRLRVENAELLRRLKERTIELEDMNKSLESFSFSVSHDLRAPLRIMGGFAQILVEDHGHAWSPEAIDLLNSITTQGKVMEKLIADLLRFSRAGLQPIIKEPIQVASLIKEVVAEQRQLDPERSIDIRIGALPDAFGDEPLLRQVFINLISNAFKYTRTQPHPTIWIDGHLEAAMSVFVIKDNGVGFDMNKAKKLFGVFHRLHKADEFEGTGVGLSIVERIIQRHNGKIRAEAHLNDGATFVISLPIADAAQPVV